MKASIVSVPLDAKRLYTKALQCDVVYQEKCVKVLFVEGLIE